MAGQCGVWGGLVRQKQNDNEGSERGEHGRHGESQPGEQALGGGRGVGGAVCDGEAGRRGRGSNAICLDVGGKTVDGFNYG